MVRDDCGVQGRSDTQRELLDAESLAGHLRHDARQRAARQAARDPPVLAEFRQHRPMNGRTIGWVTRNDRRVRYRGVTKTIIGCITEPPRSTSAD
jgi:hypothetical protein